MFNDCISFNPGGYRITYRMDEVNHCPGCGRTHWLIGRATAECAFCGTAVPLEGGHLGGAGTFVARGKTDRYAPLAA